MYKTSCSDFIHYIEVFLQLYTWRAILSAFLGKLKTETEQHSLEKMPVTIEEILLSHLFDWAVNTAEQLVSSITHQLWFPFIYFPLMWRSITGIKLSSCCLPIMDIVCGMHHVVVWSFAAEYKFCLNTASQPIRKYYTLALCLRSF